MFFLGGGWTGGMMWAMWCMGLERIERPCEEQVE